MTKDIHEKSYSLYKFKSISMQNKNSCQTCSQHKNNNIIQARILNIYSNLQLFKVLACIIIIKISIFKLKQRRAYLFETLQSDESFIVDKGCLQYVFQDQNNIILV